MNMFHNLIRVYHDGIIITQNDDIVFQNQQISQIFNIPVKVRDPQDQNGTQSYEDESAILETQQNVIQAFKKTYPKKENINQMSIITNNLMSNGINGDEIILQHGFNNIWEYIMKHKMYINEFLRGEITHNPLDGMYFKYKNGGGSMGSEKSKKL